jgi:hypothetical protein
MSPRAEGPALEYLIDYTYNIKSLSEDLSNLIRI